MIPTAHLRFVEKSVPAPEFGENITRKARVLQQWWSVSPGHVDGEWRDVPLGESTDGSPL